MKNIVFWRQLTLISFFGFDCSLSYWPDEPINSIKTRRAIFTSHTQVFKVRIGGEVTFPCAVANLGKDVITWSTGDRLLTAGPVKVYNEERLIHNHNGSEITLRDVQPRDTGQFSCQVNNIKEPMVLKHTLDVLIPPRVVARNPEISVSVFENAELECSGHGNPQPHIRWRRKDGAPLSLSYGEVEGNRLYLQRVGIEASGDYQCIAENGVDRMDGKPALETVKLTVNFPPEIDLETQQYYPKIRQEKLEMTCHVKGEPSPDVNWRRGKRVLSGHDQGKYKMSTNTYTGLHTLSLFQVTEEDLGNYTCHAANRLGWSEQTITVSGKPLRPLLLPGHLENRRSYKLRWMIESAFPIRGHNIYYKLVRPGEDRLECSEDDKDGTDRCIMLRMDGRTGERIEFNIKKEMEAVLRDLRPESNYILQVQTINDFGVSEWSEVHKFITIPEPVSALAPWSPFYSSSCIPVPLHIPLYPVLLLLFVSPSLS